ncbi:uncharacterized protein V1513DRAFT_440293 [Lipomyces chichibuensis]|uniref:uncharacterized protein n=1 Tax=Lipomyces chichibuensis TaxID=1546026 RepID=UPI003343DE1A
MGGLYLDGEWCCDCSPPRTSFRRVAKDNRAYYSCPLKFQDKNRCKFFIYEDSPEFAARTGATPLRPPATPSRPVAYNPVNTQPSPHTPVDQPGHQAGQSNFSQQSSNTVENEDEFDDPELDRLMSSVDESMLTPSKRRRVEEPTTPTPARRDYSDLSRLFTPPESSSFAKKQSTGEQHEPNTNLMGISRVDNKLDGPTRTYGDAHEMMMVHWKELLDEGTRYIRQLSDILGEKERRLEEDNEELKRQIAVLEEEAAALTEQHQEYVRQIDIVQAAVDTYEERMAFVG